jgi:ABC-type branched-subunit amino acid transport system ATPase component
LPSGESLADAILTIQGLALRVGDRQLLQDVGFALAPTGMTALMGPVGAGKSLLLRWLCGKADPTVFTADVRRADYFLAPLSRRNHPPLLAQKQGLGLTQMMRLLDLILAENPPLICLDEPTFGLHPEEAERMMQRLALIARSRALLVVSQNQREMQTHAQRVLLLANGQVQEDTPTNQFFTAAETEAGRLFLGRGSGVASGIDPDLQGPRRLVPSRPLRPVPQDLDLLPVGCSGRLCSVLGDQVFVLLLQKPQGLSRSEAAALAGAGVRSVAIFSPLSGSEALALLAYGLAGLKLPAPNPVEGLPTLRACCRSLQEALADQGPLVFLRRAEDRLVGFTLALFLVSLGVRAHLAADLAAEVDGVDQPDPAAESRLYDVELSLDLERDGSEPAPLVARLPDRAWRDRRSEDKAATE